METNGGNYLERYTKKIIDELIKDREISRQEANFIREYMKNIY